MESAHLAVNEAAAKIHRSARSVVVACLTDGETAHWVHAGDCRLLRFHDGKLVERTRDDSVVQVLFERGEITEEEMGTHPDQSRLLQSLGGEDPPSPRLGSAEMEEGDVLILCSDGFWEHLKQAELEKLSATPSAKRQQALDQAVAEAVRRAGAKADNTTAVIISCEGEEKTRVHPSFGLSLLLLIAAIAVAFAAWWLMENLTWSVHPVRSQNESPIES
jgi:serine/threonine protein phosphatase PrpC